MPNQLSWTYQIYRNAPLKEQVKAYDDTIVSLEDQLEMAKLLRDDAQRRGEFTGALPPSLVMIVNTTS